MRLLSHLVSGAAVLFLAHASWSAKAEPSPPSLGTVLSQQVTVALNELQDHGDYEKAGRELHHLFDQAVGHAKTDDTAAITETAYALRLVQQMAHVEPATRDALLPVLRDQPTLSREVAFLLIAGKEKPEDVYRVLERLVRERPKEVARYPRLAAALALVHDRELNSPFPIDRNAPDVVELFDYYRRIDQIFPNRIASMPTELLMHVVNTTSSIGELQWATAKYKKNADIGGLFFAVMYDHAAFTQNAEKKVARAGYSLPNILKYGGVCAEQAYFASEVGKAMGVPTAWVRASGPEVGHAWVGWLKPTSKLESAWDFSSGRYEIYRGLRGDITDPQTGANVSDAEVALLAATLQVPPGRRHIAFAYTDAARRLMQYDGTRQNFAPPPPENVAVDARREEPRGWDAECQLELLRVAVEHAPADARAWQAVREAAASGMTLDQKRQWSDVLHKVCGKDYPDFTLEIIKPMIRSLRDSDEQVRIWEATFRSLQHRPDLAAAVLTEQAQLYRDLNQLDRAGACYEQIIERFANAGPFVLTALENAEELLYKTNRQRSVLNLYDQTWRRISAPRMMSDVFRTYSNWYRVGSAYADRLEKAGLFDQAREVRARIGGVRAAAQR